MVIYTEISRCRSCNSERLDGVLDFGTPYISDFLPAEQEGVRAPLHVIRCADCGLVQLQHTVDRDVLFRRGYWYRSGVNESMRAALKDVVDHAMRLVDLKPGDRVLDIGGNDGTLLNCYPDRTVTVGIDPSLGGLETPHSWVTGYWPDEASVVECVSGKFKIITSIATFYAADDPNAYVAAIKKHLAPDGVWIVQMQTDFTVLQDCAVDYFCHEHLCLWGMDSLEILLQRHGLMLQESTSNKVNGNSERFVITHGCRDPLRAPNYYKRSWEHFAVQAEHLRDAGRDKLVRLQGICGIDEVRMAHIYGVGASTKANTVLQWYGITPDLMPAIIDRDERKWGLETVGSRIPIISEAEAAERTYDVAVALAWHFLDGLRQRDPTHPFLTLLPEVKSYPALTPALATA